MYSFFLQKKYLMGCLKMNDNNLSNKDVGIIAGVGIDKEQLWSIMVNNNQDVNDNSPIDIMLDCGCTVHYEGKKNFPSRSVRCKHTTYFIKYADFPYINWKQRLTNGKV